MPFGGRALLGSRFLSRKSIVRRGSCKGFAGAAADSTIAEEIIDVSHRLAERECVDLVAQPFRCGDKLP